MEHAAVGEMDADQLLGRMADDVAVGEHVVLAAELDDHARAGLFDVEHAAVLGQQRGLDVDDGGRDQLHDALDQAELALERVDVAGQGGVFAVAVAGGGGAGAEGRGTGDLSEGRGARRGPATSRATSECGKSMAAKSHGFGPLGEVPRVASDAAKCDWLNCTLSAQRRESLRARKTKTPGGDLVSPPGV